MLSVSFTKNIQLIKSIIFSFYFVFLLIICLIFFIALQHSTNSKVLVPSVKQNIKNITYGVIDNYGVFDGNKSIGMQNSFVKWEKDDATQTKKALKKSIDSNRIPVLTVEPWVSDLDAPDIYTRIIEGQYDSYLIPICKAIEEVKVPVYFRFAHEMDLPGSRYQWSKPMPKEYQVMFRKVIDTCRAITTNLVVVWSPGGNYNFMDYYPGDNYVDVIAFSVYSYEEFELATAKRNFSFSELFDSKYDQAKVTKKDIMIAEMGVSGSVQYRDKWLKEALERIKSNDFQGKLKYVIYLNAKDQAPWIIGIAPPDFRIESSQFP